MVFSNRSSNRTPPRQPQLLADSTEACSSPSGSHSELLVHAVWLPRHTGWAQVVVNLLEEDGVEAALKMALEVQFKAFQRAEPSKRLKCDHVQPFVVPPFVR